MADVSVLNTTTVAALDAAVPELWNKKLYVEAERKMFWSRFEGMETSGMPVIRKDDLAKQPGDVIHINSIYQMTGAGVTGASTLQGNEETMRLAQKDLSIDWLRHATAVNKRTKGQINFTWAIQAAQPLLSTWLSKKMDNAIFTKFGTATTALFAGDATSTATLDASDTLSTTTLDKIKTYMEDNLAEPIRTDGGEEYYGIVIHPYDAYNLRQDSTWSQAQRDANIRGDNNPLFTGAMGVYNGMIIYKNKGVSNSASKSKCIVFGGESVFRGYGMVPTFTNQLEDYGFQVGVGVEAVYGEALNDSVNTNFAIVESYATNPIS